MRLSYPRTMERHPALPQDLWAQTPPVVQASIGPLEARVVTWEALVHT